MKNIQLITLFIAASTMISVSAYYDSDGNWHPGLITETVNEAKRLSTNALDTVTGGRYSDTPKEHEERKKADRKLEDKQREAKRKYQDEQEKIQRKKEDRKYR